MQYQQNPRFFIFFKKSIIPFRFSFGLIYRKPNEKADALEAFLKKNDVSASVEEFAKAEAEGEMTDDAAEAAACGGLGSYIKALAKQTGDSFKYLFG